MKQAKIIITTIMAALSAKIGLLAIPVLVLILLNIIDYGTGMAAAKSRGQKINSYAGIVGIAKKICMWLLIVVGAVIDWVIEYATVSVGFEFTMGFMIASVVAIWLIVNEILSILENIKDIGVNFPSFLVKILENIKSKTEDIYKEDEKK